jgi:hypothetical protein
MTGRFTVETPAWESFFCRKLHLGVTPFYTFPNNEHRCA